MKKYFNFIRIRKKPTIKKYNDTFEIYQQN